MIDSVLQKISSELLRHAKLNTKFRKSSNEVKEKEKGPIMMPPKSTLEWYHSCSSKYLLGHSNSAEYFTLPDRNITNKDVTEDP
jgi:hypothetical protein